MGSGGSSAGEVFDMKTRGHEVDPQHLGEEPEMRAHTCRPSAREAGQADPSAR